MTPERWRQVGAVLHDALEAPPDARAALLDRACAGDPALRAEVESLLAADERADGDTLGGARAAVQGAARAVAGAGPAADRDAALAARLARALAGRYAVERLVGRGGMASVFLAQDLRHRRRVALKVLEAGLASAFGPERFLREIETAAGLSHPHILPLFDSGAADSLLYYVMPYVPGGSLRDRLAREGALPTAEALRLTREVAAALDYAHRHGVVHRDVKPENILLDEDGHALVADFGIARALGRAAGANGAAALTGAGVVIGTPAYMSPEQSVGVEALGGASDQYSLACVTFELLAGAPAFAGTSEEIAARRFGGPPPTLPGGRPDVPAAADAALRRALAPVAAQRFATVTGFARALDGGGDAGAPVARPAGRPAGRRRQAVVAAAALAGVVAAGAAMWRTPPGAAKPGGAPALATLAVLPFENLGDSADAYFADGMADEVRGRLASLGGLQVIAGASSRQYRATAKAPAAVARELGARYLLVGRVRWVGAPGGAGRVRVDPELVDATGGPAPVIRWQQGFDAPLTDVFQVQADIAARVAERLQVALAAGERRRLAARPTRNAAAYDAYLRGSAVFGSGGDALPQAAGLFAEAARRDPQFALAWAQLADVQSFRYNISDLGPAAMRALADSARDAAERAMRLAPDLPEARGARASVYTFVLRQPARAYAELTAARAQAPNNARLLARLSNAEYAFGRLEAAVVHREESMRLDPQNPAVPHFLGDMLLLLRRYPEARVALDRALALRPDWPSARYARMLVELADGDLEAARAVLRAAPASLDRLAVVTQMLYGESWALEPADERRLVARMLADGPAFVGGDRYYWAGLLAHLYAQRGDRARSRAYADSALAADPAAARPPSGVPGHDAERLARRALLLAYAGQTAAATAESDRATAQLPLGSGEARSEALVRQYGVYVHVVAGQRERALDRLEPLLRVPAVLSPGWLRIDPTLAPLRGHPRFERLAAGR